MEQKVKKMGGQVGIHDPNDDVKKSLIFIKEVWEELNAPASYSYSAIANEILTQYAAQLRAKQPKRIDTKNLFEV